MVLNSGSSSLPAWRLEPQYDILLLSATGYLLPTPTHTSHTYRNDAILLLYQLLLIFSITFVGLICLGIIKFATNIESKYIYIHIYSYIYSALLNTLSQ